MKNKIKETKKMSDLVEFVLCYGGNINWKKVEEEYGKEEIEKIKQFRRDYYGEI